MLLRLGDVGRGIDLRGCAASGAFVLVWVVFVLGGWLVEEGRAGLWRLCGWPLDCVSL